MSTLPNMDQWLYHALGRYVLNAERNAFSQLLPRLYGDHILQVGGPVQLDLIDSTLIRHRMRLTTEVSYGFDGVSLVSQLNESHLPFLKNSLQVIVLPHVLEYIDQPRTLIKSAFDTLTPEGHIIVTGFNPVSCWQIAKLARPKDVLWRSAHLWSVTRICHWLRASGFKLTMSKRLCFRMPVSSDKLLKKMIFFEPVGQLLWPAFGGVYFLVAQKKVTPLNPLIDQELAREVSVGEIAAAE